MKYKLLTVTAILGMATATAFADDPPQPPRTHIDTTVIGSNASTEASTPASTVIADNDHGFKAGAPDLLKVTGKLNLSTQQKAQLNDAIERADAGAAVLIKREHDVKEMIASTTPEDPMYAKLIGEQATASDRWAENRDGLRRDVVALLSPAQRARFEELQASQ